MGYKILCLSCRLTFSIGNNLETMPKTRPCPLCKKPMVFVSQKFKAPKRKDTKEWEKVSFLISHGFYFDSVYKEVKRGVWLPVPYPKTLREAKAFVAKIKNNPKIYRR